MIPPSRPFSVTRDEVLQDPEIAALYLEVSGEDGDAAGFATALRKVLRLHGPERPVPGGAVDRALASDRLPTPEELQALLRELGLPEPQAEPARQA